MPLGIGVLYGPEVGAPPFGADGVEFVYQPLRVPHHSAVRDRLLQRRVFAREPQGVVA